jgi:uncharacterized protein with ParB-like and HNH nuclease domain
LRLASVAVGELFSAGTSGTSFSVAAFQRPFDWRPDEALQLLDDVTRAAGIDAPEQKFLAVLGGILGIDVRDAGLGSDSNAAQ